MFHTSLRRGNRKRRDVRFILNNRKRKHYCAVISFPLGRFVESRLFQKETQSKLTTRSLVFLRAHVIFTAIFRSPNRTRFHCCCTSEKQRVRNGNNAYVPGGPSSPFRVHDVRFNDQLRRSAGAVCRRRSRRRALHAVLNSIESNHRRGKRRKYTSSSSATFVLDFAGLIASRRSRKTDTLLSKRRYGRVRVFFFVTYETIRFR